MLLGSDLAAALSATPMNGANNNNNNRRRRSNFGGTSAHERGTPSAAMATAALKRNGGGKTASERRMAPSDGIGSSGTRIGSSPSLLITPPFNGSSSLVECHRQQQLTRNSNGSGSIIRRPTGVRHFHYKTMELGPVRVELLSMDGGSKQAAMKLDANAEENAKTKTAPVEDGASEREAETLLMDRELLLHFRVQSNGNTWTIRRTFAELCEFDRQLHRCIFSREHSKLEELSAPAVFKGGDGNGNNGICPSSTAPLAVVVEQRVRAYVERLSLLTGSLFCCYPVLSFFELDNRGNHFHPVECTQINRPAIACAVAIRPFCAQSAGQLALHVGDIVSVVEMESDAGWWQGKLTVPNGGGVGKSHRNGSIKQNGNCCMEVMHNNNDDSNSGGTQMPKPVGCIQTEGNAADDDGDGINGRWDVAAGGQCPVGTFPASCVRLFTERLSVGEQIWLISQQQAKNNANNNSGSKSIFAMRHAAHPFRRRFVPASFHRHFAQSAAAAASSSSSTTASTLRKLLFPFASASTTHGTLAGSGIGNGTSPTSQLKSLMLRLALPSLRQQQQQDQRRMFFPNSTSSPPFSCSSSHSSSSTTSSGASKNRGGIFGKPLADFPDDEVPPPLVIQCLALIEQEGMVPGIYRQCGVQSNIYRLRREFDRHQKSAARSSNNRKHSAPVLTSASVRNDIHSVPSLLKQFFRELPDPLLSYRLHPHLIAAFMDGGGGGNGTENAIQNNMQKQQNDGKGQQRNEIHHQHQLIATMRSLLMCEQWLHPAHFRTARCLFLHLQRIARHPQTEMNARNLAIVWAPNLLRCPPAHQEQLWPNQLAGLDLHTDICAFLIQNAHVLFGFDEDEDGKRQQEEEQDNEGKQANGTEIANDDEEVIDRQCKQKLTLEENSTKTTTNGWCRPHLLHVPALNSKIGTAGGDVPQTTTADSMPNNCNDNRSGDTSSCCATTNEENNDNTRQQQNPQLLTEHKRSQSAVVVERRETTTTAVSAFGIFQGNEDIAARRSVAEMARTGGGTQHHFLLFSPLMRRVRSMRSSIQKLRGTAPAAAPSSAAYEAPGNEEQLLLLGRPNGRKSLDGTIPFMDQQQQHTSASSAASSVVDERKRENNESRTKKALKNVLPAKNANNNDQRAVVEMSGNYKAADDDGDICDEAQNANNNNCCWGSSSSSSMCSSYSSSSLDSVPLDVSRYDNVQNSVMLLLNNDTSAAAINNRKWRRRRMKEEEERKQQQECADMRPTCHGTTEAGEEDN